jgi:hypothetical protein
VYALHMLYCQSLHFLHCLLVNQDVKVLNYGRGRMYLRTLLPWSKTMHQGKRSLFSIEDYLGGCSFFFPRARHKSHWWSLSLGMVPKWGYHSPFYKRTSSRMKWVVQWCEGWRSVWLLWSSEEGMAWRSHPTQSRPLNQGP